MMKLSTLAIPAALSVAVVPLLAAPSSAAAPAAAPAAVAAAKKEKSRTKNFDVARVLRSETVDGVTYTAAGSHAFRVKIVKNKNKTMSVDVVKVFGSALEVSATPEAGSKLTLLSKDASSPKVREGGSKKNPFVVVSTKFSGTARTQSGNVYYQEATMRTKVTSDGRASTSVDVSEPVRQ